MDGLSKDSWLRSAIGTSSERVYDEGAEGKAEGPVLAEE